MPLYGLSIFDWNFLSRSQYINYISLLIILKFVIFAARIIIIAYSRGSRRFAALSIVYFSEYRVFTLTDSSDLNRLINTRVYILRQQIIFSRLSSISSTIYYSIAALRRYLYRCFQISFLYRPTSLQRSTKLQTSRKYISLPTFSRQGVVSYNLLSQNR